MKEEPREEEEGSPTDETETDATIKEETTTTELATPTDEASEERDGGEDPEGEDTPLEVNRDNLTAAEKTDDTETHDETPDSPELD